MAAHMHFQSELNQIQVSEAQVNWIKLPIQVQWKLALDWIKIIHKQTKPKATLKKNNLLSQTLNTVLNTTNALPDSMLGATSPQDSNFKDVDQMWISGSKKISGFGREIPSFNRLFLWVTVISHSCCPIPQCPLKLILCPIPQCPLKLVLAYPGWLYPLAK